MKLKAILFDLDGTLLPMDQDVFVGSYFKLLAKKLAPYGYDSEQLIRAIYKGTAAMVMNDGTMTNEERFWVTFDKIMQRDARKDEPVFAEFYENEFNQVKEVCGYTEKAKQMIDWVKEQNIRVILATNPIFPKVATKNRAIWAGVSIDNFEHVTTYEDCSYCKPNPKYYEEILKRQGLLPEECLMVGNDVTEDLVAETLGMKVFLLKDCIINKEEKDIAKYPQGSFEELKEYISGLIFSKEGNSENE